VEKGEKFRYYELYVYCSDIPKLYYSNPAAWRWGEGKGMVDLKMRYRSCPSKVLGLEESAGSSCEIDIFGRILSLHFT